MSKCYICSITYKPTLKCSANCSIDICEECIIEMKVDLNNNCSECKNGELANFTSMPTLIKVSSDVLKNNNIKEFIEAYTELHYLLDSADHLGNELVDNQLSSDNSIMKFEILDCSGPSTTNNMYKLKQDNDKHIFYMTLLKNCRCCCENYIKIKIVFSDYTHTQIELFYMNDIEVFSTIHNKIYDYIKYNFLKRDYINYLRNKNDISWKCNIENLDLLKKIVDIPDTIKICKCGYYSKEIITPCPKEIIRCPFYTICNTSIKRNNLQIHIIECEKTNYCCKYYGKNRCTKKFIPTELLEHLHVCDYRDAYCNTTNCNWNGSYKDLKKHVRIKLDGSNWMPWESKLCYGV